MTRRRFALGLAFLLILAFSCGTSRSDDRPPDFPRFAPLSPQAAPGSFRVQKGFRLDSIAAEPLVMDPVSAAYDEDGNLYVVEMSDYPHVKAENDKPFTENRDDPPVGRVRLLIDTDDDGRFDQSHIFADKLSWPTGVVCWNGGIFVAATPDIVYLKDSDGDHKADVRETVFTGFRKFNVQAVMNNLQWGLDHKVIGAGSSNGGQIRAAGHPDGKPISILRRDFQFDPNSRTIEAVSGGARFGNTSDIWGNRFLCDIRNPVQHVAFPLRDLETHPGLPTTKVLNDCAEHGDAVPVFRISPPEPWREFRARRWASLNKTMPRSELVGAGFLTSSSGLTIYRGDAYPEEFQGNVFLGEVANNLVLRMKLEPAGVSFQARRADADVEFIASTDTWFRPVNFVNAPDGTLTLLDMYRETIEHPWSIPDDIRARIDLRSGEDRGRLYRITPPGFKRRPTPRLSQAATTELVKLLEHPNGWHRETAHRLIFERQDRSVVAELRKQAESSTVPLARALALRSLQGLNALTEEDVRAALQDKSPRVREQAVQLALALPGKSDIVGRVAQLRSDPDPRVRFWVALALGRVANPPEANPTPREIWTADLSDPWMRNAVLCQASANPLRFLRSLADAGLTETRHPDVVAFVTALASIAGAKGDAAFFDELSDRLDLYARGPVPAFVDAANRAGRPLAKLPVNPMTHIKLAALNHSNLILALDGSKPREDREAALASLGTIGARAIPAGLVPLLADDQPLEIRLAALRALAKLGDPTSPPSILATWKTAPPPVRTEIVSSLLSRRDWISALLAAVESGQIPPGMIPQARRNLLLADRDPRVKALAVKLLANTSTGPASEAIKAYQPSLRLPGDTDRGSLVFQRECANCHKLGDRGFAVGPNLAGVLRRTADELLIHILDPNREISPEFVEYTVALKDGRVASGIVVGDTTAAITLRKPGGQEEIVARPQVEELKATGKSLMPEGLQKNIKPQEMADLLAYLLNTQKQ